MGPVDMKCSALGGEEEEAVWHGRPRGRWTDSGIPHARAKPSQCPRRTVGFRPGVHLTLRAR
eukprot:6791848-Pyramimonas_sp.AAC.1